MSHLEKQSNSSPSRRELMGSAATVGAAALVGSAISSVAYAGENNTLKVGVIGCGGRGSGAVGNALRADPNTKLVAMADVFADRLEAAFKILKKNPEIGDRVQVDEDHKFAGFDGYKQVIAASDVVLLATPPHFRPIHIAAAVEAGKHVFAEKPVAVDVPGIKKILAACAEAKRKNLNVVSGLCYRFDRPKMELVKRIHDGAIGDIRSLQCTYNTGGLWYRKGNPEWTQMEQQMRNWYYYTWLSGDFICEQHVHSLDKVLWVMGDKPPARCTASGGRIQRTAPKYGNIYDHFNSVFEWENGVKAFSSCRQWVGCDGDVSDYAVGSTGTAALQHHWIKGKQKWRWRGDAINMYDAEHIALFKAIRQNKAINHGDYMCKSTLMGVMGRMSAYTGKSIKWDQLLASTLDLSPPAYEWGPLEMRPVAVPGKTPLV